MWYITIRSDITAQLLVIYLPDIAYSYEYTNPSPSYDACDGCILCNVRESKFSLKNFVNLLLIMSQFYKSHLTARKRNVLIFGYVRLNCDELKLFIPLDIIRLFLMMFGDNTLYWKIQGDDFEKLLLDQQPTWQLSSSSLKIHNIEFKLHLKKRASLNVNGGPIILSVSSTESDDQYVITRYTLFCEETKYQYRKFTDNRNGEAVEWTQDFLTVNDIKQLKVNSINFVCKIEILHVYQKHDYNANIEDQMIEAYYSNIIMKNKIHYAWLIWREKIKTKTHSLFEMADIDDKREHFKSYYSPYIDNDNWCVLFTESKTRFGVQLQLLSLPFGIVSINAKWECRIFYKGMKCSLHYYYIFYLAFLCNNVFQRIFFSEN